MEAAAILWFCFIRGLRRFFNRRYCCWCVIRNQLAEVRMAIRDLLFTLTSYADPTAVSVKPAQIGIAMGGRGTDVAREASSIVLSDDDFGSIVASIRLGDAFTITCARAKEFIVTVPERRES
jgi:hypothetical protein